MWKRLAEILALVFGDDHPSVQAAQAIKDGDTPFAEADDEQLSAIRTGIEEAAAAEESELSPDDVVALAENHEALVAEITVREDAAEADRQRAAEARARILGETPPEEPEPETPEEPETPAEEPETPETPEGTPEIPEEPETPAEGTETPAEEPEPVPVTAATRPSGRALTSVRPRAHQPRPTNQPRMGLVATAGDLTDVAAGQHFDNGRQIDQALVEAFRLGRGSALNGRASVARADWADRYEQDRTLTADAAHNTDVLAQFMDYSRVEENLDRVRESRGLASRQEALVAMALAYNSPVGDKALTASGGLCGPPVPDYSFFSIGTAARPFRDSLPSVRFTRGQITFMVPPTLADATDAVGIHTVANDVAGASKNLLTVTCPSEETVQIHAVTKRVQHGNFQGMYLPELTRRYAELTEQSHARLAEDTLWNGACDANRVVDKTTGDLEFGAARDVLADLDKLAFNMRHLHRAPTNQVVEWRYPDWLWAHMRQDLYRQLPGDSTIGAADRIIAQAFAEINVLPISVLDAGDANPDYRVDIGEGGAILGFPSTAETLFSFPGALVFGDGGSLDLGTEIRDSTLNATNDFQTFMETMEAIFHVAPISVCLTMNVCPTGSTSATVTAPTCVSGSGS